MVQSLSLEPASLVVNLVPPRRSGKEVRHFLDFAVDGVRLGSSTTLPASGLASVLVLDWPGGFPEEELAQLLGTAPSGLAGGGVALYVCHVCGDVDCGAITAQVDFSKESVTWRNFALQDGREIYETYPDVGPFEFERARCNAVLLQARDAWSAQSRKRAPQGRRPGQRKA